MGKLTIVPTPIGNMEDITLRALRVLKEADLILAEDTRQTKKLLHHYSVAKPLLAHHAFNEHKEVEKIAQRILAGQHIALVSDGGTPAVSDPGFLLVRTCLKHNITVECLPGPTAFVPALVVSGLPTDSFIFEGFLPHKKGRESKLKALALEQRTIVLYESPHRIIRLMEEIVKHFGAARKVSASREISKVFEQTLRGTAAELAAYFKQNEPRGEFVVVVEGA